VPLVLLKLGLVVELVGVNFSRLLMTLLWLFHFLYSKSPLFRVLWSRGQVFISVLNKNNHYQPPLFALFTGKKRGELNLRDHTTTNTPSNQNRIFSFRKIFICFVEKNSIIAEIRIIFSNFCFFFVESKKKFSIREILKNRNFFFVRKSNFEVWVESRLYNGILGFSRIKIKIFSI